MKKEVNVGIIGLGRIGKLHLHNVIAQIPDIKLIGVSDIIENSLQEVSQKYDIPIIKNDYRYLLDNKEIDAVVICSSTDTHAKIIIEAAQAGKDIFCEKPIALYLKEIDRALKAVEEAGVKLQIGFNRRFDPSFMKAKEMVKQGKIGKPHIVKINPLSP